ncbi:MAG: hypothetical protein AAF098_18825 [Pseudomonadota bacterium]
MKQRYFALFWTISCALLSACSSNPNTVFQRPDLAQQLGGDFDCQSVGLSESEFDRHVLRTNSDGLLIPAASTNATDQPLEEALAINQMRSMICGAEQLAAQGEKDTVDILVYVHGGLNSLKSTNKRLKLTEQIATDDEHSYYPVFVSWPSDAFSTWSEHLLRIREGKTANRTVGWLTSPFILLTDILKSVGKFPSTVYYQLVNEKDWLFSGSKKLEPWLSQSWEDAEKNYCVYAKQADTRCVREVTATQRVPSGKIQLNYSQYFSDAGSKGRGAIHTVTFPVRYTLGSLWHSAISESAWGNMKRRARNITYPTYELDSRAEYGVNTARFFELILNRAQFKKQQGVTGVKSKPYRVTLIGHSMGAIVLNNVLERYRDAWSESDVLENIVYMAAAASIRDTIASVRSVIKPRENGQQAPGFYNLTLNRVSEVAETHYWALIPSGSLLVSVDQHHEDPEHPLERAMGSELNVLSTMIVIEEELADAGGPLVFKGFDREKGLLPEKHGDFGSLPFWRPSTWQIDKKRENRGGEPFPRVD